MAAQSDQSGEQSAEPEVSGTGPRLYEQAHDIIAAQIASGALAPGTHLSETRVADRFGISRPPARQALVQLADEGLLRKADGRGYYVREDVRHNGVSVDARPPVSGEQKLRSLPGWERIYESAESEIVQRAMIADWRIIEAEMARHYGVSRTVARDVLARLQQAGVVNKDERSRWYAPALTATNVSELYELRAILEPEALAKAAQHVPPDFLDQMRSNLFDALAKGHTSDWALLDRLEDEMHGQLLSYCGSKAMRQAIRLHQSLLIAHRFLYRNTATMFETEPFLAEHLLIVDHLLSGDVTAAQSSLRAHLLGSGNRAMVRIDHIVRGYHPADLPFLEKL